MIWNRNVEGLVILDVLEVTANWRDSRSQPPRRENWSEFPDSKRGMGHTDPSLMPVSSQFRSKRHMPLELWVCSQNIMRRLVVWTSYTSYQTVKKILLPTLHFSVTWVIEFMLELQNSMTGPYYSWYPVRFLKKEKLWWQITSNQCRKTAPYTLWSNRNSSYLFNSGATTAISSLKLMRYCITSAGQGSADGDADINKRYQSTLRFAATFFFRYSSSRKDILRLHKELTIIDENCFMSDNQLLPTTQMVTTIGSDDTRRSPGIIEQLQHRVTATSTERGKKRQHENDPVLAAKSTTEGIGSANLNLHRSPRLTQHIQTQPEICMDNKGAKGENDCCQIQMFLLHFEVENNTEAATF
ncbi:hypothetical protein MKW98_029462 [Papaver atlanticum]|uniref:Uncharacterized protein n=1 Tax=Papaver atlanticum TaxID=357466 RepID=A0AAD4XEW9_9MAGN|nr:hypothetical protein MKW98_029462 [Papaver atlanticum]